MIRPNAATLALIVAALAAPAYAQGLPGGGWNDRGGDRRQNQSSVQASRAISVTAFRAADAGDMLGKGRLVVADRTDGDELDKLPVYQAAVVDELARRGYDNSGYDTTGSANDGQIAQISVSHRTLVPEEAPRKAISGEASTVVSNRGSGFGLALAIDLTKPKKAIVATRLDVRIRDRVTGRVLWEGYADGQAREEDGGLDNGAMATRLATALFARFPDGEIVQPLAAAMPNALPPALPNSIAPNE